jgi:hypothetical protein
LGVGFLHLIIPGSAVNHKNNTRWALPTLQYYSALLN